MKLSKFDWQLGKKLLINGSQFARTHGHFAPVINQLRRLRCDVSGTFCGYQYNWGLCDTGIALQGPQ